MGEAKKILIIDDDADLVESMRIILTAEGYEVSSVSSGGEGLKLASSVKPDLIILDVMMETSDTGFEVSRALKKDPSLRDVPILMATSLKDVSTLDFDAGRSLTEGLPADFFESAASDSAIQKSIPVDALYEKPISSGELLATVKSLLAR